MRRLRLRLPTTTRIEGNLEPMAAIDPMHQFLIHKIVDLPPIHIGGLSLDLSITNSVVTMFAGALIISGFFLMSARRQIVPGRMQALSEMFYGLIDGVLVGPIMGHNGRPYIPFVFTIFMVVLTFNMMGILLAVGNLAGLELTFTVTAQLACTVALALITFLTVLVIGFLKNGLKFFGLFVPKGVPPLILPMMILIEFISFMVRPLTLSMRLFGNMIGGHVVMYMFSSFVVGLAVFALGGHLMAWPLSGISLAMVVALTGLELIVAFLQAFVFAALACVYLNEVVNFGHGH
jgi:F-type H+-transporting ATPase subunit a